MNVPMKRRTEKKKMSAKYFGVSHPPPIRVPLKSAQFCSVMSEAEIFAPNVILVRSQEQL